MKNVIITGASRGIGRATAELFAREGWRVAVCYNRSESQALELIERLNAQGDSAYAYKMDVSKSVEVNKIIRDIEDDFGQIDCLINNAGIASQSLFTDITDRAWEDMLAVNLSGPFYVTRAVLPGMIRQKSGSIVNISSIWGISGASCEVHYSAAKAGLIGMTKALAKEVAPSGIRVNCVAPGAVQTDMLAGFTDDELAEFSAELPMGRLASPAEIAGAILFLAGESASYITGQILSPNGGIL